MDTALIDIPLDAPSTTTTGSDLPGVESAAGRVESAPMPAVLPENVSRIVLTGFMGAGKTTVGRRLAADLGWEFVDLDTLIEQRTGLTVPQIFAEQGRGRLPPAGVCRSRRRTRPQAASCSRSAEARRSCSPTAFCSSRRPARSPSTCMRRSRCSPHAASAQKGWQPTPCARRQGRSSTRASPPPASLPASRGDHHRYRRHQPEDSAVLLPRA